MKGQAGVSGVTAICAATIMALVLAGTAQAQVSTKTLKTRIVHMQRVMGGPLPHRRHSVGYWRWWHWQASRRFANPPHKQAWLCIHRGEGAWTANTGNGFYGGLQADLSFQRAYAPFLLRVKGTANNWTPLEQMWMGEHALRAGRWFYPWPVTARRCGLI